MRYSSNNPERFNQYTGVLGSEGFNSGTHCWDVEVGDNLDWEVGVMAESAQRKRKNKDENETKRWVVYHSNNEYMARSGMVSILRILFDRAVIPLTVEQKPQRIRVQLDWDRGRVSFSDPDNNTHLHTFTHTFTERVFPYIRTSFPVKILPRKVTVTVEEQSLPKYLRLWKKTNLKVHTCLNGNTLA